MKRIIHLKESELKRMISESVRRVLREGVFGSEPPYYWSISELRESEAYPGEWEVYGCIEDSSQADDGCTYEFETPDEAYADGLEQLKYYDDGHYRLDVYYFAPNGAGDYVSGYCAECHNGKITEY